jgi:hypothetical protein
LFWSYLTGDAVVSSPAVSEGVVYVGSYDHLVYAIGELAEDMDFGPSPPYALIGLAIVATVVTVAILAFFYRKTRTN